MIAAVDVLSEPLQDSYLPWQVGVPVALIAWAVWGVIVWRGKRGMQK